MWRLVPLAVVVVAPMLAHAQDSTVAWHRFWPDAVGNEWQYRSVCIASFPGCAGQPVSLSRYEVVGDTLVEGHRFAILSGHRDGGAEGRCAVGVRPGDVWFSFHAVAGFPISPCSPVGEAYAGWESYFVIAQDAPYAPTTVEVGQQSYPVAAAMTTGVPIASYSFAADVGLYRSAWRGGGGGQSEQGWVTELEYAVIGGVEYGAPVVSTEQPPAGGRSPSLTVSPNPSSGAVELGLTLPSSSSVRVEVVDLLGRRVAVLHDGPMASGERVLRWEASARHPAGVYVVRVRTDAGEGAAQRVTLLR